MQYFFYDTCSLLYLGKEVFEKSNHFYISNITLKQLENIKTSHVKDSDVKFKARKIINLLAEHEKQYTIINYETSWNQDILKYEILSDNSDSKIILTALKIKEQLPDAELIFITQDLCCKEIAKNVGLKVIYLEDKSDNYCGYKVIEFNNDDELASLYEKIYSPTNEFHLFENQYLLLKDTTTDQIIDKYKNKNNTLERLPDFVAFESKMFGKIKPKDAYQFIAMDSLLNNKITMIRGAAGTGKSFLSLSYLFYLLQKNKISKIIIFCNTVATLGSAKLGYYPGTRNQKLLDSQIGNFLISKLGDKEAVLECIERGTLILLPMSDIRGFDSTGMQAGIYITEAQNMDIELMRLALQRVGEDSICIIDGDSDAQVDLSMYAGNNNGMKRVSTIFRNEKIYGEVTLPNIYRSHIANIAQKM